jgi:LuxR family transcriptional regulator, quorum-sensing system regulator CciR
MGSAIRRIQEFADAAASVDSLATLDLMMRDTARAFGADFYLMIHHANCFEGTPGLVHLGNYPQTVVDISLQDGTQRFDPIMEACERTLTGFFWDEVGSVIELTSRHLARASDVHSTGLADGFVVPTHIPGEWVGSCHFAVPRGRSLPRENSAALQSVAMFGFEAARRLSRQRDLVWSRPPPLTDRQRECLVLSARGKSDTVIGQLLGLSPKTVNAYMEDAKRRYGVATRGQLVVGALYASEISFQEIVGPPARPVSRGAAN